VPPRDYAIFHLLLEINFPCRTFADSFRNKEKHNKMHLDTAQKQEIYKKYGKGAQDTGSAESQIAQFTERIAHLTAHLKSNRKDFSTQQALIKLVGKRRDLLTYLQKNDIMRYRAILEKLNLRK
jgi:small subunit ribosomal protein S15